MSEHLSTETTCTYRLFARHEVERVAAVQVQIKVNEVGLHSNTNTVINNERAHANIHRQSFEQSVCPRSFAVVMNSGVFQSKCAQTLGFVDAAGPARSSLPPRPLLSLLALGSSLLDGDFSSFAAAVSPFSAVSILSAGALAGSSDGCAQTTNKVSNVNVGR